MIRRWLVPIALVALSSCGLGGPDDPQVTLPGTAAPFLGVTGRNVMNIHVGPTAVCGKPGYQNEPCTTVTVCVPGTQQCQTISDILVDTGSVGLRVFASVLSVSLPAVTSGGATLAECAQFGTGSDWGPIVTAGVVLAQEPAVNVPIQIISKGFAPTPSGCGDADPDPSHAGFNGILGVGPFTNDCGRGCAAGQGNGIYYGCTGASCSPTAVSLTQQLQNPIAYLPVDNNGILLALPQVGLHGAQSLDGVLVLGIGTQPNNQPQGVQSNSVDPNGNFTTQFQGNAYPGSFIDSGSNGLFFPNDFGLQQCSASGGAPSFYCPPSIQVLTATNLAYRNGGQAAVPFQVANAEGLLGTGNSALEDLGGQGGLGVFDWGLPFFYGRAVFEGITGTRSGLGTGPYWAY